MTRILKPEPLTRAGFAPFGEVIATEGIAPRFINYGATARYHALAKVDCEGAVVSIFRSTPREFPFKLAVMEHHPLSSQSFMPLSGRPYLVVVAPKGEFDPAAIRAFAARGDQGVNFARGTWHHFNLALGAPSDFLVIDREGSGDNCVEVALDEPILIEAPDAA
jgi:ureidoglycolate lyase